MQTIDIFNNSAIILKRKRPSYIFVYVLIMMVCICIFISLSVLYNYHRYLNYLGRVVINDDEYVIKILIKEDEIPFLKGHTLTINNQEEKYEIINISDEYRVDEKYRKYYEVTIKSKIDDKLIINNNIINLYIKLPKTTLFKEVKKKIKKGLM